MPETDTIAEERWKERWCTPEIRYARVAAKNPDRGFFIANIEETYQLYAWDLVHHSYARLTDLPGGVEKAAILPDGSELLYHRDEAGTEIGHYQLVSFDGERYTDLTPELPDYSRAGWSIASNSNQIAMGVGLEGHFATYIQHGMPMTPDAKLNLAYESRQFSGGPELSSDGRLVAIHTVERQEGMRFAVLVYNTETGEQVGVLTDGPTCSIELVGFSPSENDKRLLAFTDCSGFLRPFIWEPLTGDRLDLELPELEGDLKPLDWNPDASMVLLMQVHRAEQTLFTYDLASGNYKRLGLPPGSLGFLGGIFGHEAFFTPDGRLFALIGDSTRPRHVVELNPETGECLDDVLYLKQAPPGHVWKSIEFPATGQEMVQGWLGLPDVGIPPYPTILHTHGGPEAVATNSFYPLAQAWLDHGYAFLTVNYHGSTTFGKEFKESIWGQPGTLEVGDILAARKWLIDQQIAHEDQIFLTGYSYGGYLTLLALGKAPSLWAGGMAQAAISDWIMSYQYENATLRAMDDGLFLGTPEENPEAWKAASPVTYAENFDAPLLIIQGSNDSRTPAEPIRAFEKIMKGLEKKIELHWYEAGHIGPTTEQWIEFTQLMLDFADAKLT